MLKEGFNKNKSDLLVFYIIPLLLLFWGVMIADAGEYFNKHLPQWLETDMQFRYRYEFRSDSDFNEAVEDDKGLSLWRTRLSLMLKPVKELKLFYQLQDSRVTHDSTIGSKATLEDWADTRQLWAQGQLDELDWDEVGLSGLAIKMGRQELSYGSQRLIGPVNWSNVGQTFDAGKIALKFGKANLNVDIFGGGKTFIKSPREQNDLFDGSSDDRMGGYYAVYNGIKDTTIEQYVINRNTDGKTVSFGQTGDGEIEDYTIGARIKGKISETPFDYEVEAAKQVGNSGALDADAQMAIVVIGYTFDHSWKPRFAFEFDYASGDEDSTDSDRQTFDNLYPTNHIHYGYMDFASLQNLRNYKFQVNIFPVKKLELEANLHLIYLDTAKDNLYGANLAVKRSTVAGASDHVGNEVDLLAKYKLCDYAEIMTGYSHLYAGNFLKDTGANNDADFFYIQTTLNF